MEIPSSDENEPFNEEEITKKVIRRRGGKITSKELRERTRENARKSSPIMLERAISESSAEAMKNAKERSLSRKR